MSTAIARNTRPICLFSFEKLTAAKRPWLRNFVEYCRRFSNEVQVIVYVRPPVAYMQSVFSQQARTHPDLRQTPLLSWPNYRHWLGALDAEFGPQQVHLKLYDRERLVGGDVALDFAAELGVPLRAEQVVQKNESLPLAAIALLYAFKTLLPPRPVNYYNQRRQRVTFAKRLAGIVRKNCNSVPPR